LNTSLSSIEDGTKALEDMVTNTDEWKEAVKSLNNEILDLVELYPELSKFITFDEGILKLDPEGAKNVLKEYDNRNYMAQSAKAASIDL
jgi:hypothetical protein